MTLPTRSTLMMLTMAPPWKPSAMLSTIPTSVNTTRQKSNLAVVGVGVVGMVVVGMVVVVIVKEEVVVVVLVVVMVVVVMIVMMVVVVVVVVVVKAKSHRVRM